MDNPTGWDIPALAVLGPTASGKSAFGLWLASQGYPIEIISLDSALVFRDMDIGSAKPSLDERAQVAHHLIDVIDPVESFSAADFINHATRLIPEIRGRGRVPVILGGTMMYFKALVSGIDDLPPANPEIRAEIEHLAQSQGWPAVHQLLAEVDPQAAARLKPNDSQRLQRALEVFRITGIPLSNFHQRETKPPATLPILSVEPSDRSVLHARIAKRFLLMLEDGFLDEVDALKAKYPTLHPGMPSVRCVGYRQAWAHLAGEINHEEMIEQGVAATRQLAKRQFTWLRSTAGKAVVDPLQPDWMVKCKPLVDAWFSDLSVALG